MLIDLRGGDEGPAEVARRILIMFINDFQSSFLFGANAPYVEGQYEVYLTDPESVSDGWRAYFDGRPQK